MTDTDQIAREALALADRLSEIARSLEDEQDVQHTLDAIVQSCVDTVPGATSASISRVRQREVTTLASTDELARANDQAQYDTGEGPCLDSLKERSTVHLPDMASEQQWPAFTERSQALGVRSMLAVRLFVRGDELGAINMLSQDPHAFEDDSEHIALLFASHAAVALAGAQAQEELRAGMATRDLIGTAKGILMERFSLDGDKAFALLVRTSSHTNRKLRDVAELIVHPPAEAVADPGA